MGHQKLLMGMAAFLVITAGGVFLLVHQGGGEQEIAKETLVASVSAGEKLEEENASEETEEIIEQSLSPTQLIELIESEDSSESERPKPAPQPSVAWPQPTAEQIAPSPTAIKPPLPPTPVPPPPAESEPPPAGGPAPPPPAKQSEAEQPKGKININTAGYEELQEITGVGPVLAQRIIDYRNQNGPFQIIEEIKNVSGIGDVTFEKMKDEITVGDVIAPSPTPPPLPPPQTPEAEKININTASYDELLEITGVGPVIAQKIIDYRNENGLFQQIEDIKNVKGIGDVTFEKMKDEITV